MIFERCIHFTNVFSNTYYIFVLLGVCNHNIYETGVIYRSKHNVSIANE